MILQKSIKIKIIILTALLLGASHSTAISKEITAFKNPWELQVYLKHLNKYKLYGDLKKFLEENYENPSLSPESRLYILDDLATLYTTKLINFKKANEFNNRALDSFNSLKNEKLSELPFSNYFNENRLIANLFYSSLEPPPKVEEGDGGEAASSIIDLEDKVLSIRPDFNTEFPQEMIDFARKDDLLATGDRIQRRSILLQKNLGIKTNWEITGNVVKNDGTINLKSENTDTSLAEHERDYLLVKYYWEAISLNSPSTQYLPIIQFGEKAISNIKETDPESLFLLCRLHYRVGISYIKTNQHELGVEHLNKFDQSIENLERSIQQSQDDQKLFINSIEDEVKLKLEEEQKNDEEWLDIWRGAKKFGSGLLEAAGQVAVYTLYGLTLYANSYNAAYGGQTLSSWDIQNLTEGTAKISEAMHEGGTRQREEIELTYESNLSQLQQEYIEATQSIEENFLLQKNRITPRQLKYARFMGPNEQLDFFITRADGLYALGNNDQAKQYYLEALSLVEKQRATIDSDTKRMVFSGHRNSVYVKLIKIYSQENDASQTFHLIERSKGRVFADLLESKNIQVARNEERNFYQNYLLQNSEMNEILSHGSVSLDQIKYFQRNRDIRPVSKFKTIPLVEFNNLDQAKPITLEESIRILSKPTINSSLIQYFISPDKTIIVLAGSATRVHEVAISKEQLIGKVSRFRQLIAEGDESQDAFLSLSQELYEILIKPVVADLSKERIIISPHGPLHYLPFQLLHGGEKYLLEDHSLSYIPSATVLRYLANKPPILPLHPVGKSENSGETVTNDSEYLPGWAPDEEFYTPVAGKSPESILLLGNPNLEKKEFDLPYAEVEIDSSATYFSNPLKLLGDYATETNFKKHASSYDVLHFATHADFDNEEPFSSSLLLSADQHNDGNLTIGEIYQLELKPSLVVLSACETGLGKYSAGDEIIGFYRAFMYAGAKSIVATLWPISDQATSFLINEFYQALEKNHLGEALRLAQLKTKERYPSPLNWGGFILVGRN